LSAPTRPSTLIPFAGSGFDTHTKKGESLGINDADEAQRLVDTRNEAVRHVEMNLQIAQLISAGHLKLLGNPSRNSRKYSHRSLTSIHV
jgi:hydroxymethylglutaryl-CoA reductase